MRSIVPPAGPPLNMNPTCCIVKSIGCDQPAPAAASFDEKDSGPKLIQSPVFLSSTRIPATAALVSRARPVAMSSTDAGRPVLERELGFVSGFCPQHPLPWQLDIEGRQIVRARCAANLDAVQGELRPHHMLQVDGDPGVGDVGDFGVAVPPDIESPGAIPGYDAARRRFELLQERVDVGPQAMRGLCALRQLARQRTDRAARFIGRGGFGWAREKNAKRQGERRSIAIRNVLPFPDDPSLQPKSKSRRCEPSHEFSWLVGGRDDPVQHVRRLPRHALAVRSAAAGVGAATMARVSPTRTVGRRYFVTMTSSATADQGSSCVVWST
jgi:hypothetical protein